MALLASDAFLAMLLCNLLGICLGYVLGASPLSQYWLCGMVAIAYGCAAVLVVGQINVTFGSPGMPKDLQCASFLVGVMTFLVFALSSEFLEPQYGVIYNLLSFLVSFSTFPFILCCRGAFFAPIIVCMYVASIPQLGLCDSPSDAASNFVFASWVTVACFVRHRRDSRVLLGCAFLGLADLMIGGLAAAGHTTLFSIWLCFCVVCIYILAVAMRYQRVLPRSLRNCKFIRLDKLRDMQKFGVKIKRCQELPADTFGNVAYAVELIITSHRWLNRFTCDVATYDHPNGFRMDTMLALLDAYYPTSLREACKLGLLGLWRSLTVSAGDVVIFFDFACLPQIGLDSNGEQIPRTNDEATLFFEALPSMGALYTMYPVLVIPEVTPDVHPYFASGWCFSEFMSALLSNKLSMLSLDAIENYKTWLADQGSVNDADIIDEVSLPTFTDSSIAKFTNLFEKDFKNKKFFNESDRATVHGIVKSYLLQCLLKGAIIAQNEEGVKEYLTQMRNENVLHVLQHPFDHQLNTALHIAAALPSLKITQDIIDCGVDPHAINLHGDTAYQWFMLPRYSAGARLCRNSDSADYMALSTNEQQHCQSKQQIFISP